MTKAAESKALWHRHLSYEVIIIDDNSPDGTQEIAKRLQAAYGSEKIVSPPFRDTLWLACSCLSGLPYMQAHLLCIIHDSSFVSVIMSTQGSTAKSACRCCAHGLESWAWARRMCMA